MKQNISLLTAILALAVNSPLVLAEDAAKDTQTTKKLMTSGTEAKKPSEVPPSMRTPVIDKRMERLRGAIVRGIESGKLTTGEAHSLSNKWERIQRDLKKAEHNHILTPRERGRINREITQLADDVYKQTHDETVR